MDIRSVDLNLLVIFDAMARLRSVNRTAEAVGLSQPATSGALARLRALFDDPLFVRTGTQMEPTPRALQLAPAVHRVVQAIESEILQQVGFDPATADRSFTILTPDIGEVVFLPGVLRRMRQDAPQVRLRALSRPRAAAAEALENGQADLAVGYFPAVLADLTAQAQGGGTVAFEHERLYDGFYVCVMRRGHELEQATMDLDTFCAARHMLVSFSGRPYGFIDEALASAGRQRRVVLTVNQFFTAARVVETSDLLTVLPRHFIRVTGREQELVQRPLPFAVPRVHVDSLWHRRQALRPDHAWLRQAVAQAARKDLAEGERDTTG